MASSYLLLALLGIYAAVCHGEKQLKLVQEVFRHGDRAPVFDWKDDINGDYWKAIGPEQLSNLGKQQHYRLGSALREKYSGFLSPEYKWDELYVRSTDVNRTLMSALSHLAGLYPPTPEQQFLPGLNWQPIPVHTVEYETDNLLNTMVPCEKSKAIEDALMASYDFQQYMAQNMAMFISISEQANVGGDPIMNGFQLRDVFECTKSHNLPLPAWANDTVVDALDELSVQFFRILFGEQQQGRIRGGPLLEDMLSNMQQKIDGTMSPEGRKLFIYSAHDATVTAFLGALEVYNNIMPPYASAVIVELSQDDVTNEYSVEILYKNETAHDAYPLALPGCDAVCPWDDFVRLTEDRFPEDWHEECEEFY